MVAKSEFWFEVRVGIRLSLKNKTNNKKNNKTKNYRGRRGNL